MAALMARALRDFGVEARWIEAASGTTRENAAYAGALLQDAGVRRIALVSHYWHLPRAVPAFRAQGLEVVPVPGYAPAPQATPARDPLALLPSARGLGRSSAALHEYLGMLWYRLRYGV